MGGNNIQKRSSSQIFSCELLQKGLSQSASWLTTSDFQQRFRRIVSKIFKDNSCRLGSIKKNSYL